MNDVPELEGTGSYILRSDGPILLTCEHVARSQPLDYRFFGSQDVFRHLGPWLTERFPTDAAYVAISETQWTATHHEAECVQGVRFAARHAIAEPAELLFFRGYAGENSNYGFGLHQANGSCYCTQEKATSGDATHFELIWEPEHTQLTDQTSADARAEVNYEDPRGFSGSLVWNTRYLETTASGREWTPDDAVITGLLHRWDKDTKTLLVLRIEQLHTWLDGGGA